MADAGADQADRQGSLVRLDGRGSYDPDGAPSNLTYAWAQTAGPGVALTGADSVSPSYTASAAGSYVFELVVNDGEDDSEPSAVTITVPLLGDVDLDGDVDSDDLRLVMAVRNRPATSPNDLRDINGDMAITVRDTRMLALLCTRPRCATK